jgi:isoleucyl-tRNA synthetase
LEITDRIELRLAGDDALVEAARAHQDYVAGETLARSVSYGDAAGGTEARIDGLTLRVAVTKAS